MRGCDLVVTLFHLSILFTPNKILTNYHTQKLLHKDNKVLHMHREMCMDTFIDKFTSPVPIQKEYLCIHIPE